MRNAKKEKIEFYISELPIALKAIRQSKGLTMQAFAELSGQHDKQTVYSIETGRTKIGLNRFCDICRNLQINEPKIIIEL